MKPKMKPIVCALSLSLLLPATQARAAASAAQSSTEPPTVLRVRAEPAPQQQGMLDLARALAQAPETEANWLETNSDRSLTLYQPAIQAEPTGAIILLPDEHSHPDWPEDLHPLRLGLARHGWDTLAIALPRSQPDPLPPRTRPAAGTSAPDSAAASGAQPSGEASAALSTPVDATPQDTEIAPMELYAERVIRLCEAAIRHLQSRQRDYVIFLGTGTGATWAARCAREFQQSHLLGLALLNARQPGATAAPQLTQLLTELKLPVVDIYQASEGATEQARLRNNSARRAVLQSYHQRPLPAQLPADNGALLLREVRGRIQRYLMPMPIIRQDPDTPAEQPPGR
ncbi:DUF3530 family protein [Marinobacterium rhizophilum]|uniref:DUF3530 family protein n=1 Tax=Marinobacterium rhizophilum TaxID=420402 RepID=A0ABY5HSM5_9GAMM|nr:DUF3530 family protein [Marinobacterium rhizophilum]UTW14222.1 DUF3530 family protein [Marinobacterium rhizophilum]